MNKISPSILASNFMQLGKEIEKVSSADMLHFDVMDGHFVPNISFGIPVLESVRKNTDMFLDVHLMISHPLDYIKMFSDAGADLICFHIESCSDTQQTIDAIKSHGKKVAISLKPNTPLSEVEPFLSQLDMLLIMSVEPGFGGQAYIESSTEKIAMARSLADKHNKRLDIQVDGGINIDTAKLVTKAGANVLVAGSFIFNSDNPIEIISTLKNI